ncbi:hypothetical protein F4780DRAFT_730510 [Xylariomycetidae sp. FL0641]|nr:hypothetical protein F4780DRAFT_730510 [Xylariomycetidae sp. FL0641]
MLDENLPTFYWDKTDNPLFNLLYFTQNGDAKTPEYAIQRLDPALPQSKNKYSVALGDAAARDVILAEVLIEPEFQQPSLSATEIRSQNGVPPPPIPLIPDGFTIQLYNPDQQIAVKGEKSTWTGKESFEFEMPQQSFRMPSTSKLDRQQSDPTANSMTPKIMFRWKRDSKFSKDMTCYMTGRSIGGRKNKDPDITIALYKHGRAQGLTIYEPNLQRVEVEDRKGLEVVLLLGAEVIREIYLSPNRDSFNLSGTPGRLRKNSRPMANTSGASRPDAYAMTGALSNGAPAKSSSAATAQPSQDSDKKKQQAEIEAETKRLQAMVAQEQKEKEEREAAERQRIKRMLEAEEAERKRREADAVAAETERLRKEFGLEGQDYDQERGPNLPPRTTTQAGPSNAAPGPRLHTPVPPPRPLSAEPRPSGGLGSWFRGPAITLPPQQHGSNPQANPQPRLGRRRGASGEVKMHKKKSIFF